MGWLDNLHEAARLILTAREGEEEADGEADGEHIQSPEPTADSWTVKTQYHTAHSIFHDRSTRASTHIYRHVPESELKAQSPSRADHPFLPNKSPRKFPRTHPIHPATQHQPPKTILTPRNHDISAKAFTRCFWTPTNHLQHPRASSASRLPSSAPATRAAQQNPLLLFSGHEVSVTR